MPNALPPRMDSTRSRPAVPEAPAVAEAPPLSEAPSRLARVGGLVQRTVRAAWRWAGLGALGAASVWMLLFWRSLDAGSISVAAAAIGALVLLVPPVATAVLAWTLGDLVALPGALRDSATAATRPGDGGIVRSVWAIRGLAADGAGAWARAAGLARLASLPFVLGLLALVVLNGALVLAGVAALVWMLF